jgi:transposase
MQGKKEYKEKIFVSFRLSERVPQDNFYRRLKGCLDLSYLRKLAEKYYGKEGQKSIDTEVFFKLMLIGYLENINSDRKIIEQAQLRLDMLYFLGYDIDEPLPWHSTLSRTRKLFGEEVFLELFRNILKMCVLKGMVSGKTQAVDSAFIKANASMDSLIARELEEKSKIFFNKITENEEGKTSSKLKHSERFVSTTDPDARVSQKRGKLPVLNHLGIISVDTENHVICGAVAEFADKKDSKTTAKIVEQTIDNLQDNNLQISEVLADTGYSSGETYKFLEGENITAYIPPHGGYSSEREGFIYNKDNDCYICSQGVQLSLKRIKTEKNRATLTKEYRALTADCRNCLLKEKCCKTARYKQVSHSIDKPYYDKAHKLLSTDKGKQKMRLRASTVEPVWGTLLHFRKLKKVYTKGNDLANKQVLMAAAAYNLKKLMGFNRMKTAVISIKNSFLDVKISILSQILLFFELICWFWKQSVQIKKINDWVWLVKV